MSSKVGIVGVSGNVGKQLKELLDKDNFFEYVAGISTKNSTISDFNKMFNLSDVIIDFSNPDLIDLLLKNAIETNTAMVIGTTGFSEIQTKQIIKASEKIPIFYSSNFSIGMHAIKLILKTLVTSLPEYLIDIFEWHRSDKKDFPSGSAISLINEIQKYNNQEIKIASTRAGSAFCEHSICFTKSAERITLKHEIYDKMTFALSALSAARFILSQPAGYYEMRDLIRGNTCKA